MLAYNSVETTSTADDAYALWRFNPTTGLTIYTYDYPGWSNIVRKTTCIGDEWYKLELSGSFTKSQSGTQNQDRISASLQIYNELDQQTYVGNPPNSGMYIYGPNLFINEQPTANIGDQWLNSSNRQYIWNGHSFEEDKHGGYPETLDALIPAFMSKPLPDPMSGMPFHYRRTTDGWFLVYSVGDDGKDDDGVFRAKKGDPIKDWPWPVPSRAEWGSFF